MDLQEEVSIEHGFGEEELVAYLRSRHGIPPSKFIILKKRSIDARGGKIRLIVRAEVSDTPRPIELEYPNVADAEPVVIVGAGPAGLFAALRCIELGYRPIVLERGKNVRDRRRDLAAINKAQIVNPESNYCFGEGGAGTYSDGKLYTRSNKRGSIDRILRIFVHHGATREILFDAHPHIGTNKLPKVVSAMTESIIGSGGQVLFNTRVSELLVEDKAICGVQTADGTLFHTRAVILATGHSARDVFQMLYDKGITIEQKPFAIGVRVEHPQAFINRSQFKGQFPEILPPASYGINAQIDLPGGTRKGVFSFCMCPGGFIVPAATSQGELVVNGMSPSRRDSRFANSGLVVSVDRLDFGSDHPLAGLHYQQRLEEAALRAGGSGGQIAPVQRIPDFIADRPSRSFNDTSYQPGLSPARIDSFLPPEIAVPLRKAMPVFNRQIRGYADAHGQMIGIESRTSSPVRIPRDPVTLMHPDLRGLFPSGEGAGFAGGILSAAMDGERCAEAAALFLPMR